MCAMIECNGVDKHVSIFLYFWVISKIHRSYEKIRIHVPCRSTRFITHQAQHSSVSLQNKPLS